MGEANYSSGDDFVVEFLGYHFLHGGTQGSPMSPLLLRRRMEDSLLGSRRNKSGSARDAILTAEASTTG